MASSRCNLCSHREIEPTLQRTLKNKKTSDIPLFCLECYEYKCAFSKIIYFLKTAKENDLELLKRLAKDLKISFLFSDSESQNQMRARGDCTSTKTAFAVPVRSNNKADEKTNTNNNYCDFEMDENVKRDLFAGLGLVIPDKSKVQCSREDTTTGINPNVNCEFSRLDRESTNSESHMLRERMDNITNEFKCASSIIKNCNLSRQDYNEAPLINLNDNVHREKSTLYTSEKTNGTDKTGCNIDSKRRRLQVCNRKTFYESHLKNSSSTESANRLGHPTRSITSQFSNEYSANALPMARIPQEEHGEKIDVSHLLNIDSEYFSEGSTFPAGEFSASVGNRSVPKSLNLLKLAEKIKKHNHPYRFGEHFKQVQLGKRLKNSRILLENEGIIFNYLKEHEEYFWSYPTDNKVFGEKTTNISRSSDTFRRIGEALFKDTIITLSQRLENSYS